MFCIEVDNFLKCLFCSMKVVAGGGGGSGGGGVLVIVFVFVSVGFEGGSGSGSGSGNGTGSFLSAERCLICRRVFGVVVVVVAGETSTLTFLFRFCLAPSDTIERAFFKLLLTLVSSCIRLGDDLAELHLAF